MKERVRRGGENKGKAEDTQMRWHICQEAAFCNPLQTDINRTQVLVPTPSRSGSFQRQTVSGETPGLCWRHSAL